MTEIATSQPRGTTKVTAAASAEPARGGAAEFSTLGRRIDVGSAGLQVLAIPDGHGKVRSDLAVSTRLLQFAIRPHAGHSFTLRGDDADYVRPAVDSRDVRVGKDDPDSEWYPRCQVRTARMLAELSNSVALRRA
jgi:hypothetical protein